jgi:hypothetical protein
MLPANMSAGVSSVTVRTIVEDLSFLGLQAKHIRHVFTVLSRTARVERDFPFCPLGNAREKSQDLSCPFKYHPRKL